MKFLILVLLIALLTYQLVDSMDLNVLQNHAQMQYQILALVTVQPTCLLALLMELLVLMLLLVPIIIKIPSQHAVWLVMELGIFVVGQLEEAHVKQKAALMKYLILVLLHAQLTFQIAHLMELLAKVQLLVTHLV